MGALRAPCLCIIIIIIFCVIIFLSFCLFCLFSLFSLFSIIVFFVFLSFLSFCLFCLFVFLVFFVFYFKFCCCIFCLFVFLFFCHHYHNHRVNIYYHTIFFLSNPTIFQFYHTFHHKPLPLLPPIPPPTMFSVPKRNTGKCFERPAKILRGRQRFGDNLRGGGAGGEGVLTIWFYVSGIINPTKNFYWFLIILMGGNVFRQVVFINTDIFLSM